MPRKNSKVLRISREVWKKLDEQKGDLSFSDYLSQLATLEEHFTEREEADEEAQETAIKDLPYPRCKKCEYHKSCMRPQHGDEGVIFEVCKDFKLAFPNFPDYCEYMLRLWKEGKVNCLNPKPHVKLKKDRIIDNPQICWTCMKVGKKKKWGIADTQHTCFNCHYYQNCRKNPSTNKLPMPADPTCMSFKISPKRRGWRV